MEIDLSKELSTVDLTRAASGTIEKVFHGSSTGGYRLGISWTVNSQSASSNSSSVTASVYIKSVGNGYTISSSASKNVSITINGTTYSGTCTVGLSTNATKTLLTKTVTVGHNSDGTKTCSFSCSLAIAVTLSGTYYGTISHSGTGTFNTINLNTAPVFVSGGRVTIKNGSTILTDAASGTENAVKFPENVSTLNLSWSGATDANGDTITYELYEQVSESSWTNIYTGTAKSYSRSIGGGPSTQGKSYDYYVKAKDSKGVYASGEQNGTQVQKNTLTGSTLASSSSIAHNTTSIAFSWGAGSNTDGSAVKYDLTANGITVYGATNLTGTSVSIAIADTAPSSGAYILKSDLKSKFSGSSYTGSLSFTLTTKNNYGSTKTSSKTINVDLRKVPTAATPSIAKNSNSTAYHTVSTTGNSYFVPDGSKTIRVTWSGGSDYLGTTLKYDIQVKIGSGAYKTEASNLTTTSYNLVLPKQTSSQSMVIRVITKTAYNYTAYVDTVAETLHYYNQPSVHLVNMNRTSTSATATIKLSANTSIPNVNFTTRSYSGASSGTLQNTKNNQTITVNNLVDTSKYSWTIKLIDDVGLYTTAVTETIEIPSYTPLFSVREKGVGVNAVPDGSASFIVNGDVKVKGNLKMTAQDGSYTRDVIQLTPGGEYGMGVAIGGGGTTVVGGGESANTYMNSLTNTETEELALTSDGNVYIHTNLNSSVDDKRTVEFNKNGSTTFNTGSVNQGSGIKVVGSSGITGNLWCGTGGTVLQSVGDANLHLGRNNHNDMTFYEDKIQIQKHPVIFGSTFHDINSTERRVAFGSGTNPYWGMYGHSTALGWYDWKNQRSIMSYETSDAGLYIARPTFFANQIRLNGTMASSNQSHISVDTSHDSNAQGDGRTHVGYRGTNGNYYHYFRGKGTFNVNCAGGVYLSGNVNIGANTNSAYSINVGSYEDTFRSVNCRRTLSGTNYESRYGVSYNGIKQSSSSTNTNMWGGVIEAYNATAGSATRRYLFSNTGFYPLNDNASYCGASSHRWSALYCSTGTVYSSSKDEKDGIQPLEKSVFGTRNKSFKELIREGIKNTNMYSYKYRILGNNDTFIGFLGQELEENNPEFFKLIGSSYEKEVEQCKLEEENGINPTAETENKVVEKVKQYDIRESSVIGVLWSALQDTIIENEIQEKKIENLENQVETLTNELKQIKNMLSKLA